MEKSSKSSFQENEEWEQSLFVRGLCPLTEVPSECLVNLGNTKKEGPLSRLSLYLAVVQNVLHSLLLGTSIVKYLTIVFKNCL